MSQTLKWLHYLSIVLSINSDLKFKINEFATSSGHIYIQEQNLSK